MELSVSHQRLGRRVFQKDGEYRQAGLLSSYRHQPITDEPAKGKFSSSVRH